MEGGRQPQFTPGNMDHTDGLDNHAEDSHPEDDVANEPLILRFPNHQHVYQTPIASANKISSITTLTANQGLLVPPTNDGTGNFSTNTNPNMHFSDKPPTSSSRKVAPEYHLDSANRGGSTQHHTLGQMAEQFQERARAAARHKGGDSPPNEEEEEEDENEDDDDEEGGGTGGQQTESTGRWTKHEHEMFLEALKKYGKV